MYGDTNIFSKPKNFNFEMRRKNEETMRYKIVGWLTLATGVTIVYLGSGAEARFKKAKVKEITHRRRERLDKEHGVDRKEWSADIQRLDELYRVSEKEEIEKYLAVGKSSQDYYDDLEKAKQI